MKEAFLISNSDDRLLEILIVLIPKVDQPKRMTELRPISLCNVAYKVLTKVLVQRLRPFLDDLISFLKSSFIPGRGTKDNALLAKEIIHYMHHSKSRHGT